MSEKQKKRFQQLRKRTLRTARAWVVKKIAQQLWNYVRLKVNNGSAESINSRINTIKVRCRGFRNKQRFTNAISFYLGGLDLYPDDLQTKPFTGKMKTIPLECPEFGGINNLTMVRLSAKL